MVIIADGKTLMVNYPSVILKFFSLGLVIAAGGFWAGAAVETRPKYRDEQTLVGGTVWTQTVITIGLIISTIIDENLNIFVHAYFLFAGVFLLVATGLVLIISEFISMKRDRSAHSSIALPNSRPSPRYDKIYFSIGVLSFLGGLFTFADFIVIIVS